MATIKNEKTARAIEKSDKGEKPGKLRTLTVRSGVTAGLMRAGCSTCHRPSNHNETLVER